MSILASELVWRKPTEVSDNPTNGGIMTAVAAPSGVKNNILPDVPQSERTAGSTKYRKAFIHVANDDDLTLIAPKVYVMAPTPGDDRVTIFPATQSATQTSITGTEQQYGAGTLNATVSAAGTTCTVLCETGITTQLWKSGMTVRISDRQTVDGAGNEQFLVLSSDATYSGNVATLTFTTTPLATGFNASTPTYVSGCILPGDISTSVANYAETSGSGTYDEVTYPPVLDFISSIEQLWTVTFTSPTAFTVAGDTVGSVGSGTTATDFAPSNPAYSKPYFTLRSAGWGGTWANGNTLVFRSKPAAIGIWYKRVVPAGANSLSGNKVIVGIDGESA
jgi:hypothetical protein